MLTSWQTLISARHLSSSSSIFLSGCVKASAYVRFHVQNPAAPEYDFISRPLEVAVAAVDAPSLVVAC